MRRAKARSRSAHVAAVALLAAHASSAGATSGLRPKRDAPLYAVVAAVDVEARSVRLHVSVELPDAWTTPVLWLYADRLRDVAPSFDEFEADRIYPGEIDRGGYDDVTATIAGCAPQRIRAEIAASSRDARATRGRDVVLALCTGATWPLHLDVDTTLRLPRRYGSLGVARDVMTLGDPWYPLVVASSVATEAPRADHLVRLSTRAPQLVADAAGVTPTQSAASVTFEQRAVSHAPVVVLPIDRQIVRDRDAAVQLTLVSDAAELEVRSPFDLESESSLGPFDIDAAGLVHATVRDCIAVLRRIHFVAASPDVARVGGMRDALVVVEVPERQRIAVAVPGMLLVSDHAFRVAPVDRVRRLHAMPLARVAFAALLTPHLRAATRPSDVAWSPDLDGALLADRLIRDEASVEAHADPGADVVKHEGTGDLVKTFGFNRSVDQLLYAPRIAFGAQMFQMFEEPDLDRTGADRARNLAPMGRFLLEKLRDRLGARWGEAAVAHFGRGLEWRAAARLASAEDLDTFWTTWAGQHRRVAYRLDGVTSRALASGVETTARIARLGDTWVREPVVVEICDVDGHCPRATWDDVGAHGQIVLTTPSAYARARLDPDGRLSQDPTLTDAHPRYDDTTSHAWKPPVFGGFSAAYSTSERRYDVAVSFVMRRQFDLDGGWGFTATDGARGYGGSLARVFDFGPERDLNGRLGEWSVGASALRSPTGFGRQATPQTSAALFASLAWDTVLQPVDPMTGAGAIVTAALGLARDDGGGATPTIAVSARGHAFFWERVRTASVLIVCAGAVFGDASDAQLVGLGGHTLLRAYEADQSLGRANAYAIFEQRWHALDGAYVNAGNAAWVRALEIVPWVGGGVATSPDTLAHIDSSGVLFEVGVGARLLIDWAGIQPGTIVFDFGVPLLRPDAIVRDVTGAVVHERERYGFWFGFVQIL